MNNLQKIAGWAAFLEAAIYISAFVFFGAFWDFPSNVSNIEKFAFLADNQIALSIVNLMMYVIFGALLAVLVSAIHQRLQKNAPALSQLAAIFGVIWVCLVIASGMIANVGLNTVLAISVKEPEQAMTIWLTINAIVEGVGGGNEVVGGLWVVLLSIAAIKVNEFPKMFNYFGLFVGFSGIATVYPAEVLTEIFGLSQIVWFAWLGALMISPPSQQLKN